MAKHREIKPPHLKRFAFGLIAIPIAVLLVSAIAIVIVTKSGLMQPDEVSPIVLGAMIALPILLAILLSRAKKHATLTKVQGERQIDFPDFEERESKPDFSNLDP